MTITYLGSFTMPLVETNYDIVVQNSVAPSVNLA